MRSWVQYLMHACFNKSCTNVIYKHTHHGEYINMYIMLKWCQNKFVNKIEKKRKILIFSRHVNLSRHAMTKI
jgi:hypothetical protein